MEEENQMGEAAALGRLRQEGEMRAPLSDGSRRRICRRRFKNDNVRNEIIERCTKGKEE